jgi:hypothetical protein
VSLTLGFAVIAVDVKGARDGVTFDYELDTVRLNNQAQKIYALMCDGVWRSLNGIATITGCPEASVSARLRDLRKPKFGGHTVNRKRITGGLWIYQLEIKAAPCHTQLAEIKSFVSSVDTLDQLMNYVVGVGIDSYATSN